MVFDKLKKLADQAKDKATPLAEQAIEKAGPLATQAKVPAIVMAAGTSTITERSPYIVRTSFTLAQTTVIIAEWAAKNGIKRVVTMVNDFAPGIEAETSFQRAFRPRRRPSH